MPLPRDGEASAGARVLRQLCEAILFEGLAEADETPQADGFVCFRWTSLKPMRCLARVGAFGRVRVEAESIQTETGDGWRAATIDDLLGGLNTDGDIVSRLTHELVQTMTLAQWSIDNASVRSRRELAYARIDGALHEGHPYHPCFKARTGFTLEDNAAYGPEAGAAFQLEWLAIDRELLRHALPLEQHAFWQSVLPSNAMERLLDRAPGVGQGHMGLMPVHPWQWRALQGGDIGDFVAQGAILHLGAAGDRFFASQSLRTLFNFDRTDQPNIKLPMNLVNSSATRNLDPLSVLVAPSLAQWVKGVVERDEFLRSERRLIVLGEEAGLVADLGPSMRGQLGALWRQNPARLIRAGEKAVPFNALMMIEADGRPFADHWITRYGLGRWIEQLIDVAVTPLFHLLAMHGVVSECHGQNLILAHKDGWPAAIMLQDLHDNVEYVPTFLREPARVPDFVAIAPEHRDLADNESYWMAKPGLLGELFLDALFIYSLAEISHLLDIHYGFGEPRFWSIVRARLLDHARRFGLTERVADLGLFEPFINTESLLTRKLRPRGAECSHVVTNALAHRETIRRSA